MSKKHLERLSRLNEVLPKHERSDEQSSSGSGVKGIIERETKLSQLASGKHREIRHLLVPPVQVRMWKEHNRRYDLLNEQRCADLIEGFTRTGKQEFPAIVRRVEEGEGTSFELICGARRHWTATFLGWDLLVEVRDLNDRQAFTLQDLENRDREDISDYERATDYRNALPKYFNNNRAQMAQFLKIDKSNFQKLLELSDLPKSIVEAYGDLRELKVHHGTAYRRLLSDDKTKRRLLERAKGLRSQAGKGAEVFRQLKRAVLGKARAPGAGDVQSYGKRPDGTLTLTAQRVHGGKLEIRVEEGVDVAQLRVTFEELIKDLEEGRW